LYFTDRIDIQKILTLSYQKRIKERAKVLDLDISTYLELVDVLEENNFWIDEVRKIDHENK